MARRGSFRNYCCVVPELAAMLGWDAPGLILSWLIVSWLILSWLMAWVWPGVMASGWVGCVVSVDMALPVGAGLALLLVEDAVCARAAPAVPRNRQQARTSLRDTSLRDMGEFSC